MVYDDKDASSSLAPRLHVLGVKYNIEARTYVGVLGPD